MENQCRLCYQPLLEGQETHDYEDLGTVHAGCADMDMSSMFGDWITLEYDG